MYAANESQPVDHRFSAPERVCERMAGVEAERSISASPEPEAGHEPEGIRLEGGRCDGTEAPSKSLNCACPAPAGRVGRRLVFHRPLGAG